MPTPTPARRARRSTAAVVRAMAWMALLGMLLGPLAPRPAAPRESQGLDAEVVDAAEVESSAKEAAQRLVQRRGPRLRVGPPGARRWVHARAADLRPPDREPVVQRRVGVPRRVVPSDDDPDERRA